MNLELILGLIKVGLKVYKDGTKDKHLKQYLKIKREFQDELNKGLSDRSDLKISQLLFDAEQLARLIIAKSDGKDT